MSIKKTDPILRDIILSNLTGDPMFPDTKREYDFYVHILSSMTYSKNDIDDFTRFDFNSNLKKIFLHAKYYSEENHLVISNRNFNLKSIDSFVHLFEEYFNLKIDDYTIMMVFDSMIRKDFVYEPS